MRKIVLITLILSFVGIAEAQYQTIGPTGPQLGLKYIGLRGGVVFPTVKYKTTYGLSMVLDMGKITPFLGLDISAHYWRSKVYDTGEYVHYSCLGGGVMLKFLPKVNWTLKPYVGGGLGLNHYVRDFPDNWEQQDVPKTNLEPHLETGAYYPILIGRKILFSDGMELMGSLRYNPSDIATVSCFIGARLALGDK